MTDTERPQRPARAESPEPRRQPTPERPSQARPEHRRPRFNRSKVLLAVGVLALGGLLADKFGFVDFSEMINPNPGQAAGQTKLTDADVLKFRGSATDGLGEADITVSRMTQEWIDKPAKGEDPKPHETMVLDGGKYVAQWVVAGASKPELQPGGDLIVTLPQVRGKQVVTVEDPKINKDETSRAFWQGFAGFLGADDTDDRLPRANARTLLTNWIKDPRQSGDYHRAVSCLALASAADKAGALTLSVPVNVDRYLPPRAEAIAKKEGAPTISFRIPDPESAKKGAMLTIRDCLPDLDGVGYNPATMSTDPNSATGLASHRIPELILPAHNQ